MVGAHGQQRKAPRLARPVSEIVLREREGEHGHSPQKKKEESMLKCIESSPLNSEPPRR